MTNLDCMSDHAAFPAPSPSLLTPSAQVQLPVQTHTQATLAPLVVAF